MKLPVFTSTQRLRCSRPFIGLGLFFFFFLFFKTSTSAFVTCPQDYTIVLPPGECGTIANFDTLVWSSSVPLIDTVFLPGTGTFLETGTTTVVLAVADANGNIASCTFNVTVIVNNTTSLNCPPTVTLSLNGLCERALTAYDVFGPNANVCPNDYLLQKLSPTGVPISTFIDAFDVNQTFTLRVTHTETFAVCELQATVTGGTPPAITCPPPIVIVCNEPIDSSNTGAPLISGCYTDIELDYTDFVLEILCPDSFAYQITRTWVSTDPYGFQFACNQLITGMRYDATLIVFPPNHDGTDNPPLYCDGTTPFEELTDPLVTGEPSYLGHPADGGLHCRIISAYTDVEITSCGAARTIQRIWDVVKICPPFFTLRDTQTIVVLDEAPPVFEIPDTIFVSLSSDCADSVFLPAPLVLAECSDFDLTIETPWDTLQNELILFHGPVAGQYPILYRLTDHCGNLSEQNTILQIDNQSLVQCPADTIVTCDYYFDTLFLALLQNNTSILSQLGMPVYPENCDYLVTEVDSFFVTTCGTGLVQRRLTNSGAVQPVTCFQNITVIHVSDFEVEFPANISICTLPATSVTGFPTVFNQTCEDIQINFNDVNQPSGIPGCFTVLRTWEVKNECSFTGQTNIPDPETGTRRYRDGGDGYISFTQIIKVNNQTAPTFPQGCELPDLYLGANSCQATLNFAQPPVSSCGNGFQLFVNSSLGNIPIGASQVGKGTYNVTWTAIDSCGHSGTCNTTFSVLDTVAPVALCKPMLNVELMMNGTVQVWVVDFDNGSTDNCGTNNLVFSFSPNTTDLSRTYMCCKDEGLHNLTVYVTDQSGNQSSCQAQLVVQATMTACDCGSLVSGTIRTETDLPINQVQVNIDGTGGFQQTLTTNANGYYQTDLNNGYSYTLTPFKDTAPLNGVTTFDAVLLTRHIIGAQLLDSPYKIIAADVNKSGSVTTLDAVEMRRLILGITQNFPNGNTSWRFLDADFVFPEPGNPFLQPFPNAIHLPNLSGDQLGLDFIGIKVGDLNNNANPGFHDPLPDDRSFSGEWMLRIPNTDFQANTLLEVPFHAAPESLHGFQLALAFSTDHLELQNIRPGFVDADAFSTLQAAEGLLKCSWSTGTPIIPHDGQPAFTLIFRSKKAGNLAGSIWLEPHAMTAEAYSGQLDFLLPVLFFDETNPLDRPFQLLGHRPNPFSHSVSIHFYTPSPGPVQLRIFDPTGKILLFRTQYFDTGEQVWQINGDTLPTFGLLFYRLESQEGTAESRMVKG